MKLTIELVPPTCHYSNVRKKVSEAEWKTIAKIVYNQASYKCQICGGKGDKHPVECHEIWHYNIENKIQKLEGFIALCPKCHQCKHILLSKRNDLFEQCIEHLMKINETNREDTLRYIDECIQLCKFRGRFNWKLDISFIEKEKQLRWFT